MSSSDRKGKPVATKTRSADTAKSADLAESKQLATTETAENTAKKPAVPKGWRRAWLLTAMGFMLSLALPWSCGGSAVQWSMHFASVPSWGDRALAFASIVPVLMLVAVASRETAPRVWSRFSTAFMSFSALASVVLVTFAQWLPNRPRIDNQYYRDIPRVIRAYRGGTEHLVRGWVLLPLLMVATWALRGKGTSRAPLAHRLLLSLTMAGLTLIWAPACNAWGHKVSLVISLGLLLLSPWVEDDPSVVEPAVQRKLTLASGLWFVALAALALTRSNRL
ncbi:MAG: hypothetical protein Q8Q09_24800 [Deltaproteobacteria bacterium]|nr:hypothetical protein [Deltaproteobacteria bacterium]